MADTVLGTFAADLVPLVVGEVPRLVIKYVFWGYADIGCWFVTALEENAFSVSCYSDIVDVWSPGG